MNGQRRLLTPGVTIALALGTMTIGLIAHVLVLAGMSALPGVHAPDFEARIATVDGILDALHVLTIVVWTLAAATVLHALAVIIHVVHRRRLPA